MEDRLEGNGWRLLDRVDEGVPLLLDGLASLVRQILRVEAQINGDGSISKCVSIAT